MTKVVEEFEYKGTEVVISETDNGDFEFEILNLEWGYAEDGYSFSTQAKKHAKEAIDAQLEDEARWRM